VLLPKAIKNEAELAGMREAHKYRRRGDGAVPLHWFDQSKRPRASSTKSASPPRFESFRREESGLVDVSFDTISAAGPNGALPHYRVDETTNRRDRDRHALSRRFGRAIPDDGTTDITRTIAIGKADRRNAPPLHLRC
jgi:Xaa-Pro aminopeptidase